MQTKQKQTKTNTIKKTKQKQKNEWAKQEKKSMYKFMKLFPFLLSFQFLVFYQKNNIFKKTKAKSKAKSDQVFYKKYPCMLIQIERMLLCSKHTRIPLIATNNCYIPNIHVFYFLKL